MTKNIWGLKTGFILASNSKERLKLLENAGLYPELTVGADIDETEKRGEKPARYVQRVAAEKARVIAQKYPDKCVVAADTVIVVKGQILRKAPNITVMRKNLDNMSGTDHYVMTGYSVILPDGRQKTNVEKTKVYMRQISETEKDILLQSNEWQNVAGYHIEKLFSIFVRGIKGDYTNIIGLPIPKIAKLLKQS